MPEQKRLAPWPMVMCSSFEEIDPLGIVRATVVAEETMLSRSGVRVVTSAAGSSASVSKCSLSGKVARRAKHTGTPLCTSRNNTMKWHQSTSRGIFSVFSRAPAKLPVPDHIERPPYVRGETLAPAGSRPIVILSQEEIEQMRKANVIAARLRQLAGRLAQPGTTTNEINRRVHEVCVANGAYPSPLDFAGFPASLLTSPNEIILHGIPNDKPLENGDIISLDCVAYADGFHGDNCGTFLVGEVDEEGKALVAAAEEAMNVGIRVCGPGVPFRNIGEAVQGYIESLNKGYGIVPNFVGHGVGRDLHAAPLVPHHRNSSWDVMQCGMAFTIEPAITIGLPDNHKGPDGWAIVTDSGKRAAQFEQTVVICHDGSVEILTDPTKWNEKLWGPWHE